MIDAVTAAFRSAKEGSEIELSRVLRAPIEKVWAALTTPARLAEWMGVEWLGEAGALREGSAFDYRFGATGMESRGAVLRLEPPRLLEHSWFDNIPPGAVVRWELAPEGDGCRLTLTHRFGAPDDAPRTAAGWTQILESLAASLGEAGQAADSGKARWRAARDAYALAFPPRATRDGRRIEIEGSPALRFERRLSKPPERVWAALVEPESLARWMQARASVETSPGRALRSGSGQRLRPDRGHDHPVGPAARPRIHLDREPNAGTFPCALRDRRRRARIAADLDPYVQTQRGSHRPRRGLALASGRPRTGAGG